jgi:hypothetical protein
MGMSITHFMWGYQPHFRIEQQCNAERLFQALDRRFKPEVFLVGILAVPKGDRFQACVEPEDDFWIASEEFNDVSLSSDTLRKQYPEAKLLHSHPLAQQGHDEGLLKRSIQDAVKQVIDAHPSKPSDIVFAVSFPAKVDCYWVCVVLGLQEHMIRAYYSLQKSSVALHEYRQIPVATSLIDATIDEFLKHSTAELLKPNPGSGLSSMDTEDLLRSAGHRLMTGVVWRIDQQCIEGMHNLFRACTTISSLRYEQSAGAGSILLAKKDHPAVEKKVEFASAARLTSYRVSRKLLELASDDLSLHSNSEEIFGLATLEAYEADKEDVFKIRVLGHHYWELSHAGHALMRVRYGLPSLPRPSFDEQKLHLDLPRIFKGITPAEIDTLVSLVREAEKESHGTMLVMTEEAENEAKRLSKQGTAVHPCPLTPELLQHFTPIDGAVILSPQGICHSIGTILDGKATDKGDPGRGARYNSAVRYVEAINAPCIAVVVSEDGGIDFIPNLKPAIRRLRIDQTISALDTLASAKKINRREYVLLMDWLEEHRFYLRQEDCSILNTIGPQLKDRLISEGKSSVRLIRRTFVPHPEMDEALYYATE